MVAASALPDEIARRLKDRIRSALFYDGKYILISSSLVSYVGEEMFIDANSSFYFDYAICIAILSAGARIAERNSGCDVAATYTLSKLHQSFVGGITVAGGSLVWLAKI